MSTIVTRAEDAADAVAQLRLRLVGDVATPADANWDEARAAWNLAADQRPAIVVIAESADDVVAAVEFARDNDLRVTAQGTGHGAGAQALGRRHPARQARADARRGDRPRAADRARRGGRAVAGRHAPRGRARPGRARRLVARRGRGRLHAGRRPQLARTPPRHRREQRRRHRDRHSRRRARSHRRRQPARPVLGAARRRRQLRRGHRDRVLAVRDHVGLRGHDAVADRAGDRGAGGVQPLDGDRRRGRHVHRAAPQPAPDPRHPRALPRPVVRGHRGRVPGRPGGRRAVAGRDPGARARARHLCGHPDAGAQPHAHGSRAPRARRRRRHPARRVRPGGDLRAPRASPARGRTRRCCRSRSGISAAQLPARATATVCWPASRRRSRCSASASR